MKVTEIGGDSVTVLRELADDEAGSGTTRGERAHTATIVLRGVMTNALNDFECAVDDGVSVLKALLCDLHLIAGTVATELELELARRVEAYGASVSRLAHRAVWRFATALEVVPRTLAENALGGTEVNEVLSTLWARHQEYGGAVVGLDVGGGNNNTLDACTSDILDLPAAKP